LLKILNFVKIIHYFSKLFTSLLTRDETDEAASHEEKRAASSHEEKRGEAISQKENLFHCCRINFQPARCGITQRKQRSEATCDKLIENAKKIMKCSIFLLSSETD